ncbi:peptidyl-prolyl cis-trans isomerase C [Thermodesulfobium acidiphilum]|uniref:peptidylprolyl isomerase n=1 Tax=Thermodesulfobium acidiphilum TaxID=1794699 RepID=A0A2R4VZ81_THEAF|nr:peptidyl-prolyl cis-trans isomerase [Thermodesulfobium acidiphilum]AWB09832.1 peptidyl-prolyl cis-trans isomerase C [Thermodesulfobium acidiphilum]
MLSIRKLFSIRKKKESSNLEQKSLQNEKKDKRFRFGFGFLKNIKFWLGVLVVVLVVSGAYTLFEFQPVATVNGEPIRRYEYEKTLGDAVSYYEQYGINLYDPKEASFFLELKKQVLNHMIDNKIITQEAKKENIKITPSEVDARIDEIKKSFPSEKDFFEALAKQKISMGELRNIIEQQLTAEALFKKLTSNVTISEAEVKAYYEEHKKEFVQPEQIHLRHILVKTEQEANYIYEQLKQGKDFATLAKEYSIDTPTKDKGGDLGWISKASLVPDLAKAADELKDNEFSKPIKSPFGYHIIEKLGTRPSKELSFDEVKNTLTAQLLRNKQAQSLEKWFKEKKEQSKITPDPIVAPMDNPVITAWERFKFWLVSLLNKTREGKPIQGPQPTTNPNTNSQGESQGSQSQQNSQSK